MNISTFDRRRVLKLVAATGAAAAMPLPFVRRASSATPLKVGAYGGYFKQTFDAEVFPAFTKETGIEVQSVAEPTSETWLIQLQQAARANQAPADVSMIAQAQRLKGAKSKLWAPLDESKIPNLKNLPPHFVHKYEDGALYGLGALAWYITLVTNTNAFSEAPDSWQVLWDPSKKDKLGLMALPSASFLLEIAAATHFGGTDVLSDEEGIVKVLNKLAEVKPNVRLWYRDEGQFQQALETGEIPMGQYYHDVTGLAAANGKPVRSTFPKEGGALDSGDWVVSKASKRGEDAHVFIDYMLRPEVQARLARTLGTAPTVERSLTDLTDEEFAKVGSDTKPILPRYDVHVERGDWLSQKWSEIIA